MKGSILLGTLRWPAPPSMSPHGPLRSRGETSALVFRHTQLAQNTEQMCFSITLITLFTHSMFYSEKQNKKSTPSSYLWKVLFPTVIEIRIPFHPSGKRKKKKKPKDLGHLQKRVCWETEATAQPRSQGEAGGGPRDRGEGQNLASGQKASFEAHGSRGLAQRSGPMVLSTLTHWQRQQPQQRLSVALQRPGPSCVSAPLCPLSGNPCVHMYPYQILQTHRLWTLF